MIHLLPLGFLGGSSFFGVGVGFAAGFAGAAPPFGAKNDLISGMLIVAELAREKIRTKRSRKSPGIQSHRIRARVQAVNDER
jgi:hypothetical protein